MNGLSKVSVRVTISLLIIVELCSLFLVYKSFSNKKIKESKENNIVNKELFAMYIENDDGNYDEYTDSSYWPSGYILNEAKTSCVDSKGESISANTMLFENNKITISSNKSVFCYLYFDKDKRVYAKVASDYANNNGAALLSETESDTYPTYYYTGNITNNNILYGGYCWKMVITTETGGVKLIYNGIPTIADDGSKSCDNTGTASQLENTSKFNNSSSSLADVGYMYNITYNYERTDFVGESIYVIDDSYMSSSSSYSYYYGDQAIWNEETGQYDLKLSDGTDVTETTSWTSSNYSNFLGKYTCRSTSLKSCKTVYYIVGTKSSCMYYFALTNNTTKDDHKIKLASSVTDNGDGTYTLINPIEVSKADWYTSYSSYRNYYYCSDLTSETCGTNIIMYYSRTTSNYSLTGLNRSNIYKYGNSFKDSNNDGIYELTDAIEFWNWQSNYNKINNNHYTCFNTSGECAELKYVHYTTNLYAYSITLKDGKTIETAINEMLYAEDVNQNDSAIKTSIDQWYEDSILNKLDVRGNLYSDYLENTIFCNNRAITNLSSTGWNPNGGSTTEDLSFNYNSLDCENKTDQFTLKAGAAGGIEGYGNNALDYPIALLSYKEASLTNTYSGYLKSTNSSRYWLLSPRMYYDSVAFAHFIPSDMLGITSSLGVRPVVSLANNVQISGGNGEVTDPYQIELPS